MNLDLKMPHRWRCTLPGLLLLLGMSTVEALAAPELLTNAPPALHNVYRATPQVLSGSQPEGDAAFAWLAAQGVKTIVSVDGARPDVEAARKYGLRYVHLPIGYDGVPTNRVAELAKLAATVPGPFYVHCHHGKHRGPAAAAVLCEVSAGWSPAEAEAYLKQAGTAVDYSGLYRSVREFRPPPASTLAILTNALPEVAATGGLVQSMVAADSTAERLRECQQAGWRPPPAHPDVTPAHEALQLWEGLREMQRSEVVKSKAAEFLKLLAANEAAAGELHQLLKAPVPADSATNKLDAAFRRVMESCTACHRQFRN